MKPVIKDKGYGRWEFSVGTDKRKGDYLQWRIYPNRTADNTKSSREEEKDEE